MYILTSEQENFKKEIREYVNKEILPNANTLDVSEKFPRYIIEQCGTLGFLNTSFSSNIPLSKKATNTVIFLEEISRGLASLGLILCPHFQAISLIASHAADSLKTNLLTPALQGKKIFAYAISEENSGTNALEISTTAVKDGNEWVINGKKCWITNAGVADGYFINALTASTSKRRSISFFYVDSHTKGLIFHEKKKMTGCSNSIMGTIELQNCRIPSEHLIGIENEGYSLMKSSLNQGRLGMAAVVTGIAQRAFELAIDFSTHREFYGRKLYSHQGISFPIAEMFAQIISTKNTLYHVAMLCETDKPYSVEAAALKMFANETCNTVCRKSQEIHGAYGLLQNSEIERCFRDSCMLTVAEGTIAACKMSISSALLNSSLDQYF